MFEFQVEYYIISKKTQNTKLINLEDLIKKQRVYNLEARALEEYYKKKVKVLIKNSDLKEDLK